MKAHQFPDREDSAKVISEKDNTSNVSRISSTDLLANQKRIVIEHSGDEYLLRITRNDKLILTK